MKITIVAILAAILGLGAGFGIAVVRVDLNPWNRDPARDGGEVAVRPTIESPSAQRVPKVSVDNEKYNFGLMDAKATGSHDFLFTNQGEVPLTLEQGESTCKCTGVEFDNSVVAPGQTAKVTVNWAAKDAFGPFEQGVTVITNDPNWPQVGLTINGRVTTAIRADPPEVVFSRITAGEEAAHTARIYGYMPDLVEVSEFELVNPATAEYFEVTFAPLTSDQVEEEEEATAGYQVDVKVKPGLPAGPFRQSIRFKTDLEDHPFVELPIKGTIGSEIAVVGPGWDDEQSILHMGSFSSDKGGERNMLLVVRGPHRKNIQFKLVETVPDILVVDEEALGTNKEMSGGTLTQTPLRIKIPPGSRPANHLGSEQGKLGRITIQTNHPDVQEMRIYVRFAVEG